MGTRHSGVPGADDYAIYSPEDSDAHPLGDWQTKLVNSCLVGGLLLLALVSLSGCGLTEPGYTANEREKQQARIERLERRVDALEQRSAR